MHNITSATPSPAPPRRTRPPRVDWTALAPRVAARRLDMNIKTLEAHLRRHRIRHAIPMDRPDQVRRTCLNCDTAFVADGRFLRLCPECRAMFS
ncbi:helix-turn-helix transcriptional regulator [Komagataeibacter nataicola]|uniref:helix-turn-helix transcriptional regulator n=1 Tax=Komagataeibacter nataicola TaxID=265960 RepID=UPI0023DD2336|nr:helix-turn-helix transcriptional regulator [Komagataeibacter nataicola]WEQ55637.1 helix-turn-helix transcriptional regulator [Komagataeibacter nataicola]